MLIFGLFSVGPLPGKFSVDALAWAHCQVSITQLSFIGTQKERITRKLF